MKLNRSLFTMVAVVALAVICAPARSAAPADWTLMPVHKIQLFYPGQSSFQWLRRKDHEKAFQPTRKGDSCASCHEGEEAELGEKIASGERLEPNPIAGKAGSITLNVQSAHDLENMYFRFQWDTQAARAGTTHSLLRYDSEKWIDFGGSRLDRSVQRGLEPALVEDRLSMMIDNGKVPMFAEQGCWLTCHDGMPDMQNEAGPDAVKADPIVGAELEQHFVSKYLPQSRKDAWASWSATRSAEDQAKLWSLGRFVDLLQWRAHRTAPVEAADDGFIMATRAIDEGESVFRLNLMNRRYDEHASIAQINRSADDLPRFMYDASSNGTSAITEATSGQPLVEGVNALAFDAEATWRKGDMLPKYVISRSAASGSAADNQSVVSSWESGRWTIVWTRKLDTGNTDDKQLIAGESFSVGFAVHDDHTDSRGHYVSFPVKIGLGVAADIMAISMD